MHYLLFYEYGEDYLERRAQYRSEHLTLAWQAHDRGELMLAGVLSDTSDSAILMFRGDTPEAAERFVQADPYVKNGLVKSWKIRPWTTAVGDEASNPARPDS